MLKRMKQHSPLSEIFPNKKITNHSARKTSVRKSRNAGFPTCEIKNITGHASDRGLDPYDSGNEDEMHKMSAAISSNISLCHEKENHVQSSNSFATLTFSFGITWPEMNNNTVLKHSSGNFYFNNSAM